MGEMDAVRGENGWREIKGDVGGTGEGEMCME